MTYTLNDNLKHWAEQYETAEFVKNDPVQIPSRYYTTPICNNINSYGLNEYKEGCKQCCIDCDSYHPNYLDVEISAFITAWIAWGKRKQIIKKADFIDREIFKSEPYHYIVGNNVEPGAALEWKQ